MPRISLELIRNKFKENFLEGFGSRISLQQTDVNLYTRYHKLDVFLDRKRKYYFVVGAFLYHKTSNNVGFIAWNLVWVYCVYIYCTYITHYTHKIEQNTFEFSCTWSPDIYHTKLILSHYPGFIFANIIFSLHFHFSKDSFHCKLYSNANSEKVFTTF